MVDGFASASGVQQLLQGAAGRVVGAGVGELLLLAVQGEGVGPAGDQHEQLNDPGL